MNPYPVVPPPANRAPTWLWAVPVFTCGLGALVAPVAVALKLRTAQAWQITAGLAGVWLVGFALVGSQPEGSDNAITSVGALLFIGATIGSVVWALSQASKIPWGHPQTLPPMAPVFDANAAAVARVNASRHKRAEARRLLASDPAMARELRIGRPDLPRHFDDGGLVDINHVPAVALVKELGLTADQAVRVIDNRERLGGFTHPDDLVNYGELEIAVYDRIKDLVILT